MSFHNIHLILKASEKYMNVRLTPVYMMIIYLPYWGDNLALTKCVFSWSAYQLDALLISLLYWISLCLTYLWWASCDMEFTFDFSEHITANICFSSEHLHWDHVKFVQPVVYCTIKVLVFLLNLIDYTFTSGVHFHTLPNSHPHVWGKDWPAVTMNQSYMPS